MKVDPATVAGTKKKALSENLSSSNLDKKLLNAFSWEQLMVLDPEQHSAA